jgi:hypothetical protein
VKGIDYVAWWGAILASLVFLWDIVKWIKAGPVVRYRIVLDTVYPDSKVLKIEKIENGEKGELAPYCHIELVNIGTIPTTVMGMSASHKDKKNEGILGFTNQTFIPHYNKNLPYVLRPGEVWSCRLEMPDLYRLAKRGKPYIEISTSHKRKPIKIWPKLTNKQRLNMGSDTDASPPVN